MAAHVISSIEHTLNSARLGEFRIVCKIVDVMTTDRTQFINITQRIDEIARSSGISTGIIHVQSLHTTTGVFLSEWQGALIHDEKAFLEQLVHCDHPWRHNDPRYSDCERKNADSHLRGLLVGQSVNLQARDGRLLLGTWQSVVLAEFDGPRARSLSVQVMGN